MDADEYQEAILTCILAGKVMMALPLPDVLNAMSRAETLGPILDPTLYREKSDDMAADRELVEAALPLWRLARKRAGDRGNGESESKG